MTKISEYFKGMRKSKKQSFQFGCLTAIGLFLILIGILALIPAIDYEIYENQKFGFQMKYPDYWDMLNNEGEEGAIVVFWGPVETVMDKFQTNANVTYVRLSGENPSIEQFSKKAMRQITGTFEGYVQVLNSSRMKVAGLPAWRFIYMGQDGNKVKNPMKYMHVWVIKDNTAYILTFASEKKYFRKNYGIFKAMIKSFEFI